jgi:hypothetical protein
MSASISKEAMVAHVLSHFPEKTAAEANDIIILTNSAVGNLQPKISDMKKEAAITAAKNLKKYEMAKETFLKAKDARKYATE